MKTTLFILFFILASVMSAAADEIHLNDGTALKGIIIHDAVNRAAGTRSKYFHLQPKPPTIPMADLLRL